MSFVPSVSGLEDRFLTNLAVMLSGVGVPGMEDVMDVVPGIVAEESLELEGVVEVFWFEWPP